MVHNKSALRNPGTPREMNRCTPRQQTGRRKIFFPVSVSKAEFFVFSVFIFWSWSVVFHSLQSVQTSLLTMNDLLFHFFFFFLKQHKPFSYTLHITLAMIIQFYWKSLIFFLFFHIQPIFLSLHLTYFILPKAVPQNTLTKKIDWCLKEQNYIKPNELWWLWSHCFIVSCFFV